MTASQLRWGERTGKWRRLERGVYAEGGSEPTDIERAVGAVVLAGGVACGHLAGILYRLDSVTFDAGRPYITLRPGQGCRRVGVRERVLVPDRITSVAGIPCTDGLQTLVDLAESLDELVWEQALECALRKRLVSVPDLTAELPILGRARVKGTSRVRRVLEARPPGAPPTESLLETLMLQLAREVPGLGDPVRQFVILDPHGQFVARIDLAWPELGLFIELDGEHHAHQPRYDARRETAIVALTGWLCGRFTWTEVVRLRATTIRRLADLAGQARLRPLPASPTPRRIRLDLHEAS